MVGFGRRFTLVFGMIPMILLMCVFYVFTGDTITVDKIMNKFVEWGTT